ncbi:MAG: DUF5996 family protein [Candidatus Promineifilaceae bacterium]
MKEKITFPSLEGFEPTRQTMHWYTQALGVLPRKHAEVQPKWRHISLKLRGDGLYTEPMKCPEGEKLVGKIDFLGHKIVLLVDGQTFAAFSMAEGLTGREFGDRLLAATAELGLSGKYERRRFENDEPRVYDPEKVPAFWQALVTSHRIFGEFKSTLEGEMGPLQFWTHGFDMTFEWFGSRLVEVGEDEQKAEYPAQINLGFYPGNAADKPYFYSNPWPFEAQYLLSKPLPKGASWHTEGWLGSILPYDELVGDPAAEERLREYARVVHETARPTLQAGFRY